MRHISDLYSLLGHPRCNKSFRRAENTTPPYQPILIFQMFYGIPLAPYVHEKHVYSLDSLPLHHWIQFTLPILHFQVTQLTILKGVTYNL